MSKQNPAYQPRKKQRGKGLIRDVLPQSVSENTALDRSLDSLLKVQRVPIIQKNKSFPGATSKQSQLLAMAECSSNESFASANSQVTSLGEPPTFPNEMENNKVPIESLETPGQSDQSGALMDERTQYYTDEGLSVQSNVDLNLDDHQLGSPKSEKCILTLDVTDESFASYEEEIVEVPSIEKITVQACDNKGKSLATEILHTAINEESENLPSLETSDNMADLLSSATTTQAYLEALAEDSDVQIESLLRMRDEEMQTNRSLRSRVKELETLKENLDHLVSDLESSYSQTYSELSATHEKELELVRLDASRRCLELEKEVQELTHKLLVSDSQISAKEELESELQDRVEKLESSLQEKEEHCKEELERVIAKYMKCEAVSSAKDEIGDEMVAEYTEGKNTQNCESGEVTQESFPIVSKALATEVLLKAEREVCLEVGLNFSINPTEHDRVSNLNRTSLENVGDDDLLQMNSDHSLLKRRKRDSSSLLSKFEVNDADVDLLQVQLQKFMDEPEESQKVKLIEMNYKLQMERDREDFHNRLKEVTMDRDRLLAEKATWISDSENNESTKAKISYLEMLNLDLKTKMEQMKEKVNNVICEKDSLIMKSVSLEAALSELQKEHDNLMKKNRELEVMANISKIESEKRASLEVELENLKTVFNNTSCRSQDVGSDISYILKELEDLRADRELLKTGKNNFDTSQLNWSRMTEVTQYMDYQPAPRIDEACQTSKIIAEKDSHQNTLVGSGSKPCSTCKLRGSLEQDLEVSWTERCEVEQQLAVVISENAVLRQRTAQLEAASRRASGLVDAGVPSAAAWLQLRSCVKEIVAELAVLHGAEKEQERDDAMGINTRLNSVDENNVEEIVGGRSSPEGGRESPRLPDGGLESANDCDDDGRNVDASEFEEGGQISQMIRTQDLELDQNSSALLEMVQGLIRCLGGEDLGGDRNSTLNSSLNVTLNDGLSVLTDTGELCRCLNQLKEEVGRLFALSRQGDPAVARLQEEVRSLEHQVAASDKQVRSTRAFLEEQAAERELERDEAIRQIEKLTELLRTRDRQLAGKELLQQDIDTLEQQLTETQKAMQDEIERRCASEVKLEQTLQKVKSLREVLDELEAQLAESGEQLSATKAENLRLQEQIVQCGQLSLEREYAQRDSFSDTLTYVARLEEELTALRHQIQAVGPDSIASARTALRELETAVVRRTRDLELVQVAWSGLSSASEELSTRDHVDATRCATPDEMVVEAGLGLCEDVERLKERLMKHTRVEEAALKKIKELEQIASRGEELQVDLEVAMRRLDSLLIENASLKARVEEERPRVVNNQVVLELENKTRELENKLETAKEALAVEKKLCFEKCRRAERLQGTLDAREAELRAEIDLLKDANNRYQSERSLRLAAEVTIQELTKSSEGKNDKTDIEKSISSRTDNIDLTSSKNNSSNSSKKVRFNVPESFVGESLTPISPVNASVLRDAGSCDEVWAEFSNIPRIPHLWDSISSVAALQLSPRGPALLPDSSSVLNSSLPDDSVPVTFNPYIQKLIEEKTAAVKLGKKAELELSNRQKEDNKLRGEVLLSNLKLEEVVRLCKSSEEKYRKNIAELENELSECKRHISTKKKELEIAQRLAEETIESRQVENRVMVDELEEQRRQITNLKENCAQLEESKEKALEMVTNLRTKLETAMSQVEKHSKEALSPKESLKQANREIDIVQSEKELLVLKEAQLLTENKKLDEEVMQLEVQEEQMLLKLQKSSNAEESEALKNLQEQLLTKDAQLSSNIEGIEFLKHALKAKEEELDVLKKEMEQMVISSNQALVSEKVMAESTACQLQESLMTRDALLRDLKDAKEEIESVRAEYILKTTEGDRLKEENDRLLQIVQDAEKKLANAGRFQHIPQMGPSGDTGAIERDSHHARLEKLCADAATQVSNLRSCLEVSLKKSASLEEELVNVKICLEGSEKKVAVLESEFDLARRRADGLAAELAQLQLERDARSTVTEELETVSMNLPVNELLAQLDQLKSDLVRSRSKGARYRKALEASLELEREGSAREKDLQEKLAAAEREVRRLRYVADHQSANLRGLERLHHHGMTLQRLQSGAEHREIRSAGDGEDRVTDYQWTVHRLESYRKALVWQKQYLTAGGARCRAWSVRTRGRRPTLRTVAIVVVALLRMRFLVRRWRSRLPPLVSPPRRGVERALMLPSPPCKDPGLRVNYTK